MQECKHRKFRRKDMSNNIDLIVVVVGLDNCNETKINCEIKMK